MYTIHHFTLKNLNNVVSVDKNNQVTDEGIIALASLPKLEKLTLGRNEVISDEVFKYFPSLKSLKLLDCQTVSNATLICIAKYCSGLKALTVERKL